MRVLPATQTLAQLGHRTLVLELTAFRRSEFEDACTGARECEGARILAHEMTHWFDIVGTTWGQDYLDRLFQAYDAVLRHPSPQIEAFPAVLRQFDAERAILFPAYFKVVNADAPPRDGPGTWQMRTTTGVRFTADGAPNEDDPILFARFHEGPAEIARQPISVGALLEMRALGAEIQTYRELRHLRPSDEGLVEQLIYQRQSVKQFYDPELTTYSAAAHLLSNALAGLADADLVMTMGPRLADFALNVTPTHIQRLIAPAELSHAGPRRVRAFRDRADRGFLFGCLCYHLRTVGRELANGQDLYDALLRQAGLPASEAVYDAATKYIASRRPGQLANPELRRMRGALQTAGLAILAARRAAAGLRLEDWSELPSPQIMDYDAETFRVGPEVLSDADVDFLNDCSEKVDDRVRSALRAARGLDFHFNDYVY